MLIEHITVLNRVTLYSEFSFLAEYSYLEDFRRNWEQHFKKSMISLISLNTFRVSLMIFECCLGYFRQIPIQITLE